MKIAFVAGFGPIVKDTDASRAFSGEGLGSASRSRLPATGPTTTLRG
jgi:hypothetical protein